MKYAAISLMILVSIALSSWECDVDTDPITDETITLLSTRATSGTNRWGEKPYLALRFTNGEEIEIFILWGVYVGSSNLYCTVRVDDAEAESYTVNPSTNNEGTFFRGYSDMKELFVELLDGIELVCRFTPYGDNPITATFSLYGFTSAAIRGGIDLDSFREGVAEAIQEESTIHYQDSTIIIGGEILYRGEVHILLEISRIHGSSDFARVRIVPTSEYINNERAEGYWVTASQLESIVTTQVVEEENQEGNSSDESSGKPGSAGDASASPYEDLIGSQVLFYDEIHTIIDVDARSGIVRYTIAPGDSSEVDYSTEGITVSPEHVIIQ